MSPTTPNQLLAAKLAIFQERYQFDPVMDVVKKYPYQTIYKGYDKKFNTEVLLIRRPLNSNESERNSLMQEVKMVRMLKHDCLWDYLDCYRLKEEGTFVDYAVLELTNEGCLVNVPSKELSKSDIQQLTIGLLHGVKHLHDHNISHLYLQPSHILVNKIDGEWFAKLGNFIIPTAYRQPGFDAFLAPEEWRQQPLTSSGKTSDIWSVGILIYWLHTGELPYTKSNKPISFSHLQEQIKGKIPQLPFEIRDLVKKCLVVDPAKRTHSIDELILLYQHGMKTVNQLKASGSVVKRSELPTQKPTQKQVKKEVALTSIAQQPSKKQEYTPTERAKIVIHKKKKESDFISQEGVKKFNWQERIIRGLLWSALIILGLCVGIYSSSEWCLSQGAACLNSSFPIHCTWWIWLGVAAYSIGVTWLVQQKRLPATFISLLLFNIHFFYLQIHFPSLDTIKQALGLGQGSQYDFLIQSLLTLNMVIILVLFISVLVQLYYQLIEEPKSSNFMVPPNPLHNESQ